MYSYKYIIFEGENGMRTQTIVSYWSANNFDMRLNDFFEYLEANHFEVVEVEYRHNWAMYCASVLYK